VAAGAGTGRFPLSYSQEVLCARDEGESSGSFGPRHILVNGWRLAGKVDPGTLAGALNDVVVRHEILRTTVVRDASPRYQEIHPPAPVPLLVREVPPVAGKSADLRAEELFNEAEAGSLSVRDLPLLRAILGRLGEEDWALVLVTHHTATDAWSMSVLIRDLMNRYASRCGWHPPDLPGMGQYREFAAAQRARSADTATRAYWRRKLDGGRIFRLPAQHVPAGQPHSSYSTAVFTIDAAVTAGAVEFAKAINGSLFMVLLAAFYLLANQITGTTDPVVPTFSFGRDPRFFDTVGFCVNVLPIRTTLPGGGCSFRELATLTRASCVEAYAHDVPFPHIVSQAPQLTSPVTADTATVVFEVVQAPALTGAEQAGDISCTQIVRQHPPPGSRDLPDGMLWALEVTAGGEIGANVLFDRHQFGEEFIAGLVTRYRRILTESLAHPDEPRKPR
jgi:condensation enzyme